MDLAPNSANTAALTCSSPPVSGANHWHGTAFEFSSMGRDRFLGPGLATWDFSVLKEIAFRESLGLEFRAEIFNLLNRANFNTRNLVVFTPSGVSGKAGATTSTSTTSRQVRFALKLHW